MRRLQSKLERQNWIAPVASPNEKPPNVKLKKGRWYWEPSTKIQTMTGAKSKPLGSDQPNAWALARKLNAELATMQNGANPPGTVAWVFDQFFETDKFRGLARSTQIDYRWLAKCLGAVKMGNQGLGAFPAMSVRARHADVVIANINAARGHSTSHYCARFARRVWSWAGRKEFVTRDNPWSGMELKGIPERDQVWSRDEVAAFIAAAAASKTPSIAVATRVAYAFGHRKIDVLSMPWESLEAEERDTSKTNVKLPVVAASYPVLYSALEVERARQDDAPSPSTLIVRCELNHGAWQVDVFSRYFRTIANAAGIRKELQFRDIRATAATELKDAGADIIDMSTHTGHKTVSMARRYARRTPEQFQRAAGLREGKRHENEANTASGTASGTRGTAFGNGKKTE